MPEPVMEGPANFCVQSGLSLQFESATKRALITSLMLLDMAGMAHSEGDDQAAQELLNLAKETLKLAADLAIGLSPAGRAKDLVEGFTGYSVIPPDFDKLSNVERVVSVLGAVTVSAPTLKIIVKYAKKSRVIKKIFALEADKVTKEILENSDEVFEEVKIRLPKTGGHWTGERGKSIWISDDPVISQYTGGEGVPFKNFFPDFSKWSVDTFKVKGLNGDNANDFVLVDSIIAKKYNLPNPSAAEQWRKNNKLTIHHVEDGVTIQLVPSELHNNTPHLGGAALLKKILR